MLAVCCHAISLYAQQAEKFGKVSKEVLEMTTYEKDKDAEAVVLFDVGNTYMDYVDNEGSFVLRHERHKRIKILKQDGTQYANVEIPFYVSESNNGKESIYGLKAYTYNIENGKVIETKMDKDAVFVEEVTKNWQKRKFTLPNVKVGSVIEYRYTLNSDFISEYQPWTFQDEIPTLYSEYKAAYPEYYSYQIHFTGYEPLAVSERGSKNSFFTITSKERRGGESSRDPAVRTTVTTDKIDYRENTHYWVAKDMPAFKREKFITTAKDYISKVEFELSSVQYPNSPPKYITSSWKDVSKRLLDMDRFGSELERKGDVKDIAQAKTAKLTDPVQKLAALYSIAREIKWNEEYRLLASKNVKQILEDKIGNSADINLLFIALCRAVNINASPVVLSTRRNGRLRTYSPSLSMLNHVIVAVELSEDQKILIDAADKTTPLGILPYNCLNNTGILLKDRENIVMLDLSPAKTTKSTCMATMNLATDGTLQGELNYRFTDYEAVGQRKIYFNYPNEQEYIKKNWEAEKNGLTINSFEAKDANDISKPLSFKLNVTNEEKLVGDILYIEPFFEKVFTENPFTQENRKFPVDFAYPTQENYVILLQIPDDYQIDELPKNEKIALPDGAGSFTLMASQQGNKIQMTCNYILSKTLFVGEEYPLLKDFVAKIIAKQSEQIVLKKKQ